MDVKATANGYYQTLRSVGEIFSIKDESHLGGWMEVVKQEVKKTDTKPNKKAKKKAKYK